MINKTCFIGILSTLDNVFYKGKELDKLLDVKRDLNSFPYNYIIDQIHALADGFFNEEELESNRCGMRNLFHECNQDFKLNWESVRDIIYTFVFHAEFGRSLDYDTDDALIVIDKQKGIFIANYHMDSYENLYDMIVEWIERHDLDILEYILNIPSDLSSKISLNNI